MKGWKTWLAVIAAMGYAVGGYVLDMHDADKMIEIAIAAMGLVGLGSKLDKASKPVVVSAPEVQKVKIVSESGVTPSSQEHWLTDLGFENLEDAKKHYAAKKPEEPHV